MQPRVISVFLVKVSDILQAPLQGELKKSGIASQLAWKLDVAKQGLLNATFWQKLMPYHSFSR